MMPIKIENPIRTFITNVENDPKPIGSEVKFPPRTEKQIIEVEGTKIKFLLTYPDNNVKLFRFQVGNMFSHDELHALAGDLNFVVKPHVHHPEYLMGSLENISPKYKNYCLGSIVSVEKSNYLLVYSKSGSTSFEEDIIYVHGIWKVILSEMLIKKLAES